MNLSTKFGWKSGKLDNKKDTQQSSNKELKLLDGNENKIDYSKKKWYDNKVNYNYIKLKGGKKNVWINRRKMCHNHK